VTPGERVGLSLLYLVASLGAALLAFAVGSAFAASTEGPYGDDSVAPLAGMACAFGGLILTPIVLELVRRLRR
jgi:hypothetical protein